MGDPQVAVRTPAQTIRDPYAGFAAIRVDPVHNEVVVMDEFKFNIYVYDRLATTPASAAQTMPKRFIGGGKTLSRYNSDGYVDRRPATLHREQRLRAGHVQISENGRGQRRAGHRAPDAVRRVRDDRR